MSKVSPNMIIQRIVWGTKYFMWDGPVEMECPSTGYKVEFTLSEEDEETNRLEGRILKGGEEVMILRGVTGKKTEMWKPGDEENKEELYNFDNFVMPNISYPPVECQLQMDSLKLWKVVADPIIVDDMWTADLAKKAIEQAQRVKEKKREAAGLEYEGVYFVHKEQSDGAKLWVFNEKEEINREFLIKLAEKVKQEELKKKEEEEAKRKEEEEKRSSENEEGQNPEENPDEEGGCTIS